MFRRLWYGLCQYLLMCSLAVFFRYRALWRERVPADGGVLLVANHQSYLDPILATVGLGRMATFMARRTLFRNPLFGWLLRSVNAFPIHREGLDTRAMREAIDRLRRGWALLVFPEGTRTRDGEMGPLRGGVGVLARRAGVPIVPVAIEGAYEAWPRGGVRLWRAQILAGYGRPIGRDEAARMSREGLQERVRSDIMNLLRQLRARKAAGRRAAGAPSGCAGESRNGRLSAAGAP